MTETTHAVEMLDNCPNCGARPGHIHDENCAVQRCSHCGRQAICCDSPDHDPKFSRWTGLYPGTAECFALGLVRSDGGPDMNAFEAHSLHKRFFVKPL